MKHLAFLALDQDCIVVGTAQNGAEGKSCHKDNVLETEGG